MSDLHIDLLVADAVCAPDYQAALLDQADRARVSAAPALAMRTDWQVSRFLKQQAKAPVLSLSHSHGTALLAAGAYALPLGVDIEFHRDPWPSNLAERYFADGEKALLKGEDPVHAGTTFFRLWSRKEAYYKCAGGAFLGGALSLDLRPHRVGDVMLWDLQGPFAAEGHSLGLAAMAI